MTIMQQEQLFEEIEMLPLDIKTKLVDKLLNSINQTNEDIDSLWIEEINKRRQEIENGTVSLIDGDDVFRKIKQKFH